MGPPPGRNLRKPTPTPTFKKPLKPRAQMTNARRLFVELLVNDALCHGGLFFGRKAFHGLSDLIC